MLSPLRSVRAVCVSSVDHAHYGYPAALSIDPVDDPVGATACTVAILEWRHELLADTLRVLQQRADDELVRGERDGLGKLLGELTSGTR